MCTVFLKKGLRERECPGAPMHIVLILLFVLLLFIFLKIYLFESEHVQGVGKGQRELERENLPADSLLGGKP